MASKLFSFNDLKRTVTLQERYRGQKRRTVYKTNDKGQMVKTTLLEPKQRSKRKPR